MVRLISLILLLATWWLISQFVEPQTLPGPDRVLGAIAAQMRSGDIFFQLGVTLARVLAAFTIAMAAGTAIGLLMGRVKLADRLGDPWLIVLLNLPALVIIVLAFIWGGLTEIAGVLAVAINKLPNTVVTVREGARALDSGLDEMATVFALSAQKIHVARGPSATRTLSRCSRTFRPFTGLEDRSHRGIAWAAEWHRISDRCGVPVV